MKKEYFYFVLLGILLLVLVGLVGCPGPPSYSIPNGAWGVYVKDNYAYVEDGENGLKIVDVSCF